MTPVTSRTAFLATLAAFALMGAGAAAAAADSGIGPMPQTRAVVVDTTPITRIHTTVQRADGQPAAGAVVVTSAGGKAVTDEYGAAVLEVAIDADAPTLHVTAVASDRATTQLATAAVQPRPGSTMHTEPIVLQAGAECQPQWVPTFGSRSGVSGHIRALAVYDDGSGPALYVAGSFPVAGSVWPANNIARWDGQRWWPVGGGVGGPSPRVNALAVFDDGTGPALYAGGRFSTAGSIAASGIARWNGNNWSPLGSGIEAGPEVEAMAVFDDGSGPGLYVGGNFWTAGGVTVNGVARWDQSGWSGLDGGVSGDVDALTMHDDGSGNGPALYVGGTFSSVGSNWIEAKNIARWDGQQWSALGAGVSSTVRALATFNDGNATALYVGGGHTGVGFVTRWDGSAWSTVGNGFDQLVHVLDVFNDGHGPTLFAGGRFTESGGDKVVGIAMWDAVSGQWIAADGTITWLETPSVRALAVYDSGSGQALFAGGSFYAPSSIARLESAGGQWGQLGTGLGPGSLSMSVHALEIVDDGSGGGPALFVGGVFGYGDNVELNNIGKWTGNTWEALGSGVDGTVRALAAFDDGSGPALYAGGNFTIAGGVTANRIARWDGASWSPLGDGMNAPVHSLFVFDDGSGPALYAGGEFTAVDGVPANRIARWDGQSWSALGGGVTGEFSGVRVNAMTAFETGSGSGATLHVAGAFSHAGNVPASNVARWDGTEWSPLGKGITGSQVSALAIFDDGSGAALYAGGLFFMHGGDIQHVARWDGSSWGTVGVGTNNAVNDLAVLDDGSGSALYAGGQFTAAGDVTALRVAKWDGLTWSPLGSGITDAGTSQLGVLSLTAVAEEQGSALIVGGAFVGSPAGDSSLARWQGCIPQVVGDLNGDGVVDVSDLLILLAAWGPCPRANDCPADLNGDGAVDVSDLLILLANWG